jgi:ribosomal protein S6--L-glutamate ligase
MNLVSLSSGTGWHVQDLLRAAAALGHELRPCSWRNLVGRVHAVPAISVDGCPLDGVDGPAAILLRTMPPGSLEQIVFRMDLIQRLETRGTLVLNPPRAIEAAVDKYLALARLEAAGVPVPETIVCQRLADARGAFQQLGGDVVIKPIFGSEGFGLTRASDADTADRVFAALERINAVMYLQRFVLHGGEDLRLFVLGDRVLAAMRRLAADWRTNVARGGVGEAFSPDAALVALATKAAAACGALIAGVDIAIDPTRGPLVLEVNAVPGWRELARVTGLDVAAEVLRFVAECVEENRHVR